VSNHSDLPGEPTGATYTPDERRFLVEVAHANLDKVEDSDTLKHFADVWWNLCNWEATRAAVLDGKAQGLLTLASIVGAVVAVSAALGGDQVGGSYWRAASIFMFIVAAFLAVWALRVADHGGFFDRGVFEALTYTGEAADWFPAFQDKDHFRLYLREIVMQRWSVYRGFKDASTKKARRVARAQYAALFGALLLAISVIAQLSQSGITKSDPAIAKAASQSGSLAKQAGGAASKP